MTKSNPFGTRAMQAYGSDRIRNRIRPTQRTSRDDYREYVKQVLSKPDFDPSAPGALEKVKAAAKFFAGIDDDANEMTDPYARKQAALAKHYSDAGRTGQAKMATLRSARLEESSENRRNVAEYRARQLAGQQRLNKQFAEEKKRVGGAFGTMIDRRSGVPIPIEERTFEQAQAEKRTPLAPSHQRQQVNAIATSVTKELQTVAEQLKRNGQLRAEAIRIIRSGTPEARAAAAAELRDYERQDNTLRQHEANLMTKKEAATARGPDIRAGDRPTMRAFDYMNQREDQRQATEETAKLERAWTAATNPQDKARIATAWLEAEKRRRQINPQAPDAVALGTEQAEIQSGVERRAPDMAALNSRMIAGAGQAVGEVRAAQESLRADEAASAEQSGLTLPVKQDAEKAMQDREWAANKDKPLDQWSPQSLAVFGIKMPADKGIDEGTKQVLSAYLKTFQRGPGELSAVTKERLRSRQQLAAILNKRSPGLLQGTPPQVALTTGGEQVFPAEPGATAGTGTLTTTGESGTTNYADMSDEELEAIYDANPDDPDVLAEAKRRAGAG